MSASWWATPTETVRVLRPEKVDTDAWGCDVAEYAGEDVAGVLAQPAGTSDLGAERPDGVRAAWRFHFPKSYEKPLAGCLIEYRARRWRVAGDPQKLPFSPGPFDRAALAEAVDG